MDMKTYDQINVPATVVGDAANYMLESQTATIAMHEGSPLYIELPASVVLEITYTEPGLQGDRSTGGTSPQPLRPATRSRFPCSWRPAPRSRLTPAPVSTSVA